MSYEDTIRQLTADPQVERIAYQSTAVAVLRVLQSVLAHERSVSVSAMSLGQTTRLAAMTDELDAVLGVLKESIRASGATMVALQPEALPPARETLWWYSLVEALHILDMGTARLRALADGQAPDCLPRRLVDTVVALLETHEEILTEEADAWMTT